MGTTLALVLFSAGYLLIALENVVHLNKSGVALFTGVSLWALAVLGLFGVPVEQEALTHHFGSVAQLMFFLLAAMAIVELIDTHHGFNWIQQEIRTANPRKLLWLVAFFTFFLSAVLDNLTTAIVMVTLLKKLLNSRNEQLFFAGFVVIAANAGGAWSPIGDVTTIMLWNSGHISTLAIVSDTLVPSLLSLLIPLLWVSLWPPAELRGVLVREAPADSSSNPESKAILLAGVLLLLWVPLFKFLTHLPPFMGMLFSLSVLWLGTEILHRKKAEELKKHFSVSGVLQRIDTPSVLFFLGILLAVGSLEAIGALQMLGEALAHTFPDFHYSNAFLGILSSVVDNVPLVAGVVGMYPLELYPSDHEFWTLLAFCAGTGGSLLIIGSAAGVAAMGLMKIDFVWYLKRIAPLALLGYLAGVVSFMAMTMR